MIGSKDEVDLVLFLGAIHCKDIRLHAKCGDSHTGALPALSGFSNDFHISSVCRRRIVAGVASEQALSTLRHTLHGRHRTNFKGSQYERV